MPTSARPLVDFSDGPGIALGGPAGTIALVIAAEGTAVLPAPFDGVWDLEIELDNGDVVPLLEGTVHVTPEVTR